MARRLLACLCVLAVASAATAQTTATYDASKVVASWDRCPVIGTPWDASVFDPSVESLTGLADYVASVPVDCLDAVMSLAGCASDSDYDGGPTSLSTSDGCCVQECSDSMRAAATRGCFSYLLAPLCNEKGAAQYRTGLFNAARRCANLNMDCAKL
ncbi:hypothetical protein Rsub_01559 [Raphidocelis subcapitata]|uniref:Uncharacterized protein n=1 Tax=Raphidocelis subcapitata TaxID=307507 RepID=A0A2V0NSW0_9CHLO|nr:hypothetical protein Rsub_01559 [Raphidocelis subcapitata]|eukprot:GBF88660.1 hypothetical protein Rsub_01559 [Raphidocelis subcapitata]